MRAELVEVVYPIIAYGLRLKDRLNRGDDASLNEEQANLRKLLKSSGESRRLPDFGGQPIDEADLGRAGALRNHFLGSRYALACWLDDLFIFDSPWGEQWKEYSLEYALYQSRDRAYVFWDQVRLAESRVETDALEVFYLCVMLGFRGDYRDKPDRVRAWRDTAEAQLSRGQSGKWQGPGELPATTNVPPLRAREQLRGVMLAGGLLLGLLVPVIAYFVVSQMGR
jgi:type VI secretion system protein ImpK